MPMLDDRVKSQVQEFFSELQDPVTIEIFPGPEAEAAKIMSDLANEVADLSDIVMVTETATRPPVEPGHTGSEVVQGPITEILDHQQQRTGIRFLGLPSGHEFSAFLEAIKSVSRHSGTLSQQAREALSQITNPVHIQVFTTPTWPYCPRAVRLAHEMALASPNVVADMVDAQEFMDLATQYSVYGVPKSVINGRLDVTGAVPESQLLKLVLEAAGQ